MTLGRIILTERSEQFMKKVWEARNNGADTEEKLVSEILKLISESVRFYTAQDGRIVLDQNDLIDLSKEFGKD